MTRRLLALATRIHPRPELVPTPAAVREQLEAATGLSGADLRQVRVCGGCEVSWLGNPTCWSCGQVTHSEKGA